MAMMIFTTCCLKLASFLFQFPAHFCKKRGFFKSLNKEKKLKLCKKTKTNSFKIETNCI